MAPPAGGTTYSSTYAGPQPDDARAHGYRNDGHKTPTETGTPRWLHSRPDQTWQHTRNRVTPTDPHVACGADRLTSDNTQRHTCTQVQARQVERTRNTPDKPVDHNVGSE